MVEFILYVADQERSKRFYTEVLGTLPVLDVPGMTEFQLNEFCKLGLMPEKSISKILQEKTPDPAVGNGISRCEIYYHTQEIENMARRCLAAGAGEISAISERDWGDRVGYFSDPDGHILALAQKISSS